MPYWTKTNGTGGALKSEEDFVVEEIPLRKFFSKYARGANGMAAVDGPYVLAMLRKSGITTRGALGAIQKDFGISKNDIGYAGLKDKFAVTSQYITIRKEKFREITGNPELSFVSFTDKMMQIGELEGNKFIITLRGCKKPENAEKAIEELKSRGMPNYFGSQRFGKYGDNHMIGRLILQKKNGDALNLINRQSRKKYSNIRNIDKKMLKFFIHAYQSHIFNSVLDLYVSKNKKPLFTEFPIVGFDTKLKNDFAGNVIKEFLEKDKISQQDFSIDEMSMRCEGSSRPAFVKPKMLAYSIEKKTLRLEFELPKGSYATVLIREVTKN